jgi:dTDP-4-amino-4,6-dideoxygalactose transaminase
MSFGIGRRVRLSRAPPRRPHSSLAPAAQLQPGTEVVTTPITDIGTINPILLQNLVPVFADVDPDTAMPTVDHIR